ncbi:mannose-6-phosphate isomerase, class I [Thermoactinomyces sp. AMNI-1]|uniref:Mannose-6-phosphate isomerase n=1 Tax=Thermoactinomyces mirandus TaxID=2756294 RepID=A0A7W1XQ42_9BACL|nr:mannose-6-phosphate isomerase, class I [Thermoactinomyces mirandus]
MEPLFLQPVFKERIWGGTALRETFGYQIPSARTGECWAISAHPNGQNLVKNGQYRGKTLAELWENHQELFGHHSGKTFPLLTKILDASTDLSVQVHPDESYANEHEHGEHGKTECWYILDCQEGAEIIYGHHARSRKELKQMIEQNRWEDLLRRIPVKPGDFFYVPSRTVHALGAGTLVLETQQSSDVTYRLYDYDRARPDGKKRELHIDKALDVITVPHRENPVRPRTFARDGANITTFVESKWFTVEKWEINATVRISRLHSFQLASVIGGEGHLKTALKTYPLSKGEHFILPYQMGKFEISGNLTMILSRP